MQIRQSRLRVANSKLTMLDRKSDISLPTKSRASRTKEKAARPKKLKSRKNLTRFTYETTAFEGWRLCVSRAGTTFTKYFSDRSYGGGEESLEVAEQAKENLLKIVDNSRRINGKLSKRTIDRCQKLLKNC